VKLFSKNLNLYDHDTSTSQTDGRTTCHGNTVLRVASRGKNRCRENDGSYACVRWRMCMSACFSLTVGVRQGGVLSPVLFTVYVNSLLLRLQQSNYMYDCVIASQFWGCIMYADDLVLLCPTFHKVV